MTPQGCPPEEGQPGDVRSARRAIQPKQEGRIPVTVIFNLLTAAVGMVAAWYWYRSSKVPYPGKLHGVAPIGGPVTINTNPLLAAVQEGARLNKLAARWSAVAAFLVALSAMSEVFGRSG